MPRTTASPATRRKSRKAATDTSDQVAASKAEGTASRTRKRQASSEAPKPKRRRSANAGVGTPADSIEHGFVPKAPPPGAPAAPMLRPAEPEAAPTASALGPATVTTHPVAPAATPGPRHRCSACEYPLPRSARFCRRCGVAQRPAGQPPAAHEAQPASVLLQPAQPVPPVLIPEPPATHRLSCGACGIRLPTHAKFCRACGALQLQPAEQAPLQVADEVALPVEPPQELIETPSVVVVADAPPDPASHEPPSVVLVEAAREPASPGTPETRPCRVCAEPLPVVARFCMFCAAPQTLPAVTEPVPEPEIAATLVPEEVNAVEVAETAEPAEQALQVDLVRSPDPLPPHSASPSPVESEPPPEPEPEPRPSSLAPDVIERLEQARSDINTIGRSLESLKRSLTPHNATRPHAPSARRAR